MNECPQCGRVDKIEKVSAIVQSGTHQIQGTVPVSNTYDSDGWKIGTNYENYSGTQQSNLARLLTPENPNINNPMAGSIFETIGRGIQYLYIGGGVLLGLALSVSSFSIMSEELLKGILIFFGGLAFSAVMIGITIWGRKKEKVRKQKELEIAQKWNYSFSRWNQLYYCYRDDCIFIPQENKAFPISALNHVIDWHPETKTLWQKLTGT